MPKKLLRMHEVAAVLDVSVARAYELCRLNIIPHTKIGRQVRVCPDHLDEFIRSGGQALPGGWRREPDDGCWR